MSKQILVNSSHYETRVATLEDGEIRQLHIEREEDRNVVGNVYKGIVKRVLPGMQAAFLELGLERTAFLYVDDIIDEPFGTDVEFVDQDDHGDDSSDEDIDDELDEDGDEPAAVEEDAGPEVSEADAGVLQVPAIKAAPAYTGDEKPPENDAETDDLEVDDEGLEDEGLDEEGLDLDEAEGDPEGDEEGFSEQDEAMEITPDAAPAMETPREVTQEAVQAEAGPGEVQNYRESREPREGRRDGGPREGGPREAREGGREGQSREGSRESNRDGGRDGQSREGGRDGNRQGNREGGRSDNRPDNREASADGERSQGRNRSPRRGELRLPQRSGGRGRRGRRSSGGRPQRRGRTRRPRGSANIQDLLKEGQEILVQVAKAPIGTKGARLTTHISLPGRNLVLMPTVKHLGISRRISSEKERRRLRDIFVKKIRTRGVGFIIRTVAENKSLRELKADADYLMKLWERIKRDSKRKGAPALIHEDLSLGMRSVRDFFTDDVDSFIIDNPTEHDKVLQFIGQFIPRLKGRVKLFKGPSQLFEHYGIEAEISRALGKKVWLKSGGYLLIDQSEALTAIDVNTGRYVGSRSLEETILKTNLEAVKEIAYQLRIRNVGGIIIIDLIDMESLDNREKVYRALQEALGEDRAKTNILKISELGLVEMTRKRTHEDLVRYLTEACSYCDGRGYHKSRRTICFEIFREIEKEALSTNKQIVVFANPEVVNMLKKDESKHVERLQQRFEKNISIKPDPEFHVEQYEVFGKH